MANAVWTGSLSFGLLTIPIRLYPAARSERVHMHLLHSSCHTRLREPLYCPKHERIVDRAETVRGYEYEKGRYVILEDEELKKIAPPTAHTAEILAFVKESEVDPVYFESSYFALPEKDNPKPYLLLVKALEKAGRMAIAKLTMHLREYTIFVRPKDHGLTVHTMYFADEVRRAAGYGEVNHEIKLKPQELKLAEQLVESLSQDFRAASYHDGYQERLKALIEAKRKGETIVEEPAPKRAPVIDIMEALKKSVEQSGMLRKKKAARVASGTEKGRRAAG